ncbi:MULTISPECIES: LacI family DNA-binding transcriptional regulator [Streptomyces]|uniref:LacI family DNA-binding transcriptional regulator n=1 Tax=Streptomyces TaxID=1883 RepID=UPI0004CA75CF|nr:MULTISPECIES: LacI family DNA-binding transcriptional regulator [Streptomyces]MBL0799396.1 LacI family DNA-binding transcriptional regulator [Streptomyces albidoflavus]MBV1956820.1 LacI family DNA-binding transcriptional regulator [Streptomyces sp. BV333]MCG5121313.1 LacI family DNA-binding transcriptional regulator [Streptomyces sp. T7(2022)]MCR0989295.1 LacI family DNA-binding transcriptional regulator [Streptomyces albidoflavus]WTC00587.1 LacI family DNA-binding transcriptional regulator
MLLAMRDDEKTGRITLAQVAQRAGVSISTVSKVLNGRQDVAAPTRIKVERLLEAHAYRRTTRSAHEAPLIEIVFHELESIWAMELIRGVENVAKTHGAGVVLTESGTRHAPGPEWMEAMLQRRPLGVVLVFSALPGEVKEQLRARSIPFVIIDPAGDPDPDVPSVGSANWNGGLAATRHLVECGHRRIGVITGPEDMLCSRARLDGYRSAMTMAGLEVDPGLILFGDFHVEGGYDRATEMLSRSRPPTAIFAGSDLQALGVLEAARVHGLRVPHDLSVVGYDDVSLARWASPALTTIHQPLRQMAEEATQMLMRLRDKEPVATRLELATSLVVRKSTGAPAGG